MCLGIPLKIVEINKQSKEAIGEINGIKRKARTDLLPDLKMGDYVMVHAGFAIEKINEKEAHETLETVMEFEELLKNLE